MSLAASFHSLRVHSFLVHVSFLVHKLDSSFIIIIVGFITWEARVSSIKKEREENEIK